MGVPVESADCIRVVETGFVFFRDDEKSVEYYIEKYNERIGPHAEPCWSVGRLAQIYLKCVKIYNPYLDEPGNSTIELTGEFGSNVIGEMIDYMDGKYVIGVGELDFSKWEE